MIDTTVFVPVLVGFLRGVALFEDSRFDLFSDHVDDSARKRFLDREGVFKRGVGCVGLGVFFKDPIQGF